MPLPSDRSLSPKDIEVELIEHATAIFGDHCKDKVLPESVRLRVSAAVVRMMNGERLAPSDVNEAKAAFSALVARCLRQAAERGSTNIDADDFEAAWLSADAHWPYAP